MKKILFIVFILLSIFSFSYAENKEKWLDKTICNGKIKISVRDYWIDKDLFHIEIPSNKHLDLLNKHWFSSYLEYIKFIQKIDNKWVFDCDNMSDFYISDLYLSKDKKHYILWYYYTDKNYEKKYSVILKDDKIIKKYSITWIEIFFKDIVKEEVFEKFYKEWEKRNYQESSFVKLSRYNDDYIFLTGHFSELRQVYNYCKIKYEWLFLNWKNIMCFRNPTIIHNLDIFLEKFWLKRYFSKTLKWEDRFWTYEIPKKTKQRIRNILETKKENILKNKNILYKFLEKYFKEYEKKNLDRITKSEYIKYELYNYIYWKLKILEILS